MIWQPNTYTAGWNVWGEWFLAVNHDNHKIWVPSILTHNLWLIFLGMKQKKKFFFMQKKIQNGRFFKMAVFQNRQFSKFFVKMSWIGPWVCRINWCEGHWCSSTYMVVRLSDIRAKTGKKCIFCVFRLFLPLCRTASRPYRLSYINALRINQSY